MKIHVPSIPEEGQSFAFDQDTPWFLATVRESLPGIFSMGSAVSGEMDLLRTNQNISCSGSLSFGLSPLCSRCGQRFQLPFQVPIQRHMVPYFSDPRKEKLSEDEEVELDAEDLEFSFYHNEEIDLAKIFEEEIQLALPMRFVCRESCRGLCPHCGINLNEGSCSCSEKSSTSPFAVLKGFKVRPHG
jgi:DUF177 domain-containing protein